MIWKEERREVFSRSPKTINEGESPQEVEFNVKTLNSRRMNNMNSPNKIF